MTSFRTELTLSPSRFSINNTSGLITIGSCFSDHIGERLAESKFNVSINPMGILYSPLAIHHALENSIDEAIEHRVVCHDGIWNHFDYHSKWGNEDQALLITSLQRQSTNMKKAITNSSFLLITYGTAWGFRWKRDSRWVANCHKTPTAEFDKELISVEEVVTSFSELLSKITAVNPGINVILTVSPVRHIKDTLPLNAVSKSALRLACHQIEQRFPDTVEYFPAFEIMMDDLRDYRFYDRDLIHPNEIAIDYLWNNFSERYFSPTTQHLVKGWNDIQRRLNHKPFHPKSNAHQAFLTNLLNDLLSISTQLNVTSEIEFVKSQLHAY